MDAEDRISVSPQALYARLGNEAAPLVVDMRPKEAFDADTSMIVSAIRLPPGAVLSGRHGVPPDRAVVVYGGEGDGVGRDAAAALRAAGIDAAWLEGGIAHWAALGLPRRRKSGPASAKWVTRERPKIDRIACPWLIRRFIDRDAQFLFVPSGRVFATAAETGATAFDIPGAEPFSHDGERCSFDAFLAVYGIADPALDALAIIVRGADTARLELAPQAPGLLAVSLGLSSVYADDHAMLERGMIVYDALYAWCRDCRDQGHDWNPAAIAARA